MAFKSQSADQMQVILLLPADITQHTTNHNAVTPVPFTHLQELLLSLLEIQLW